MKVPACTLVPLPDELSFEEGAAISCGTGTAYGALKRLDVSGRDTLAVFGQGPVGLSATMLGAAMGARVIAVDIAPERLALAKEFGADAVVNSKETDPVEAIHDLTARRGRGDHDGLHRPARARAWPRCGAPARGGACASSARAARPPSTSASDLIRRSSPSTPRGRSAPWARGSARASSPTARSRSADLHRPLPPRPGRRGLQALRHADHRQGRVHLVLI